MKHFLLICLAFLAFSASAQSPYKPFFSTTSWYMMLHDMAFGQQYYWKHGTDTLINNQAYKKIYTSNTAYQLMREDQAERKVYITGFNNGPEVLLYDFGMTTVGAQITLHVTHYYTPRLYTLASLDSVMTNDGYRRRFSYIPVTPGSYITVIEGVGSLEEPFFLTNAGMDPVYQLQCSYQNDQNVYSVSNTFVCPPNPYAVNATNSQVQRKSLPVYPNPAADIFQVEIPESAEEMVITLTDMMGQNVYSEIVQAGSTAAIKTAEFSNGTYVVSVQTAGAVYRSKVVVSR